ncbi:stage V sporulation protein K [Anoxybacillus gonensis]|uniref:Stage V sporulation protein K n=3 Tax=Anoxybacillus TaxID=150247 RepID=A0AAW7TJ42_9BACL|nr:MULTISPECIES: stage V sporulation protein K [Anoxybacillus]AXM90450.1 stage V sporulation protein K [Anoxybacillus ayderensis G10]AKS38265.1 stage V sporulation protein K [Anoxybacillus gonensis]KGP60562.1 stage V sporulation protein K [Anoxybacillus gonensis]MBA2877934.1 stage V sporulation protein K [Anoxybacillus ayderensis]MBW9218389.1 stage V sporulation protein K [Anoxybacillus sp. ST70]
MSELTMKQTKSQINIVLNAKNVNYLSKEETTNRIDYHQHAVLKEIQKELDELVGLNEVKKLIKEIYAWLYINKARQANGLKGNKQSLHMIFKGNPGTGKTTVARILGKLFLEMNVLSKGHFIEAERADLVGEYIGHTANKTRDLIKKARGGILFIDEAYSLARGGEKDFGKEAIDTLVKGIEDFSDDLVVILAGYPAEMDYFLSLNPGLPSRFPLMLEFPDYTTEELVQIAKQMLHIREYELTSEAERKLREHIEQLLAGGYQRKFSNGRYIRNLIEKAIRKQAVRLLHEGRYDKKELMIIRERDLVVE